MYSQVESLQECEQLCMDNEHCVVFQVSSDFTEPGRCDLFQMGSGSEIFTGCNGQIMANNQWADTLSITEAAIAHTDWQCYGHESEGIKILYIIGILVDCDLNDLVFVRS